MTAGATSEDFVLGRDVGIYGRILRVLAGGWLVLAVITQLTPIMDLMLAGAIFGFLAVFTIFYTVVLHVLGERVFARLNPWTSTALLLTPIITVALLDVVVGLTAVAAAALIYVGASNVIIGLAGYGGCEVVGLPVVVLRRRYTVYCAMNALDAAERPLMRATTKATRLVAGIPALLAALYYFFAQSLLQLLGVQTPFDPRWPALLFLPAVAVLARVTWIGARRNGWRANTTEVRTPAAGTIGLGLTIVSLIVFGNILFAFLLLTAGVFLVGIAAAFRQAAGRRHASDTSPGAPGMAS